MSSNVTTHVVYLPVGSVILTTTVETCLTKPTVVRAWSWRRTWLICAKDSGLCNIITFDLFRSILSLSVRCPNINRFRIRIIFCKRIRLLKKQATTIISVRVDTDIDEDLLDLFLNVPRVYTLVCSLSERTICFRWKMVNRTLRNSLWRAYVPNSSCINIRPKFTIYLKM